MPGELDLPQDGIDRCKVADQCRLHGEGIGRFVLTPFDVVEHEQLGLAPNVHHAQLAVPDIGRRARKQHGGFGSPDFSGPGPFAQPGSHVDGVAITIAIHIHHFAAGHAHADLHAQGMGPAVQADLVLAQHGGHCRHRTGGIAKDAQHPIPELLDHPAAVGLDGVTNPLGDLRHGLGSTFVAQRFIQGSAA